MAVYVYMSITQRNLCGYDLPVIEWKRVRKSRNIAADSQCVLSIATKQFDLVVEGHAVRVAPQTVYAFGTDETGGATRY